ncbi:MAG: TonB-dependent receptor [Bacteroidetes bacterium]|nr:TonB-dependent receptor [Bacteroidota bacterium]
MSNSTNQNFPLASNFDYQKVETTTKLNSKINIGKVMFSGGLSADYIKLNSIENNSTTMEISDSFLFIQPSISVKYSFNSKWNFAVSYDLNNNISNFSQLYTPIILTSFNALVQNPNFVNTTRINSFTSYINYNNILKSFFLSLKGNLNQNKSDATFSNELNSDGFMVTEVIKQPNSLKNYGFTLYVTKGFLGSFKTELTYAYNISKSQLFFNDQFLDAINRRQSIDFGLSWDKGSWFTLDYKAKFNFGTSATTTNEINNSILFQNLNLDIYTTSSTRINFGLDSSRTATSKSDTSDQNTLFNMSFHYKPSKKVNINASLNNVFNTQFFRTTNSYFNFVNVYQFSLRPRQFTIGFNYSL